MSRNQITNWSNEIDKAEERSKHAIATSGMTRNQKWLYAEEPELEDNVSDEQIKAWANEDFDF